MRRMKLAIFHCEEIPTLFLLKKAGQSVGFETHLFHYKDIRLEVSGKDLDLKVGDVSLKDFSIVFGRGFWNFQSEVSMLAAFCKKNSILLFDPALLYRQTISKMYDLMVFKLNGLPVPKTIFAQGADKESLIRDGILFPIVAKEDKSRQGKDVFLLNDKSELREFLRQINGNKVSGIYQFQEFIPADFDIRVVVLGGKVLGAIERRSRDPSEFRHNISLGGIPKKTQITRQMRSMAIKASRILNYEFAGVDFITNKESGETYILEVNRSPGFDGFMKATNIDVPLELMKFFLRFPGKKIK